jgi:hypothetical protein
MMRKIYVSGLTLIAVFALSYVTANSAFAVSKFLLGPSAITALIPILISLLTGTKLLLQDMGVVGEPDILCAGSFDGMIEAGGIASSIESLLMANNELLEETVGAKIVDYIECEEEKKVDSKSVLIVTLNLLWPIEVELFTV